MARATFFSGALVGFRAFKIRSFPSEFFHTLSGEFRDFRGHHVAGTAYGDTGLLANFLVELHPM